jgi:hypothetical protein
VIDDRKFIRDLKAFTRGDLTLADLPQLEAEMYGFNDRARAVMLGAMIEAFLEKFLLYRTRPTLNADDRRQLFDFRGPLGDFASKILIAYAFNWYGPDTRNDLDLIRILRNEFAHSRKSFDLTTPEVASVCGNLRMPKRHSGFIPSAWLRSVPSSEAENARNIDHPRTRFITTCHILAEGLLGNSGQVYEGSAALDLF